MTSPTKKTKFPNFFFETARFSACSEGFYSSLAVGDLWPNVPGAIAVSASPKRLMTLVQTLNLQFPCLLLIQYFDVLLKAHYFTSVVLNLFCTTPP